VARLRAITASLKEPGVTSNIGTTPYIAFVGALAFLILVIADRQQYAAVGRLSGYKAPALYGPPR
jgi:hypothetical protein